MSGFGTQGTTLAGIIHSLYMGDCSAHADTKDPWRETYHMVRTPLSWLMFNDKPFLLL